MGFVPAGRAIKHLGGLPERQSGLRRIVEDDLPRLIELDTDVFGACRSKLLRVLFANGSGVITPDRCSFGLAWMNDDVRMVGPLVAADIRATKAIVSALGGRPSRIDVPGSHPELSTWIARQGLAGLPHSPLLIRGSTATTWQSLFALAMQATG